MRRRVNIAAGLMHGPRLLILDEPTVGVDLKARAGLAQLLRELKARGLAIMLTTHDLDEAESLADRVAIIVAGRIEDEGEPERLVERLFGTRREVSIGLGSAIGRRTADELARGLAAGGLVPQGDGRLWQGVVDASADALDGLVRLSFESGGAIEDVRVRRPGLAAVLTEYVRRSAGTDEREG
jgi:ABC-2 type transport system ATP-binding protein